MLPHTYGHKATYLTLRQCILDLVNFDLTEALDLYQITASGCVHGGDGVVAVGLELCDVDRAYAVGLDGVDVDDEAVLRTRSVVCSLGR
jgi:hypothetical protein